MLLGHSLHGAMLRKTSQCGNQLHQGMGCYTNQALWSQHIPALDRDSSLLTAAVLIFGVRPPLHLQLDGILNSTHLISRVHMTSGPYCGLHSYPDFFWILSCCKLLASTVKRQHSQSARAWRCEHDQTAEHVLGPVSPRLSAAAKRNATLCNTTPQSP